MPPKALLFIQIEDDTTSWRKNRRSACGVCDPPFIFRGRATIALIRRRPTLVYLHLDKILIEFGRFESNCMARGQGGPVRSQPMNSCLKSAYLGSFPIDVQPDCN